MTKPQTARYRFRTLLVGIGLAFTLVAAAVAWISLRPQEFHAQVGDSRVSFSADRRVVLPGTCAVIAWQVDPPAQQTIGGQPVPPVGSEQICPDTSIFRELRVTTPDGETFKATVFIGVFLQGQRSLIVLAALAGVAAGMVGVTWLQRREISAAIRFGRRFARKVLRDWLMLPDVRALAALTIIALLLLVGLRFWTPAHSPEAAGLAALVGLTALGVWLRLHWHPLAAGSRSRSSTPARTWAAALAILAVCTLVSFYLPMRDQIWIGGDEGRVLRDGDLGIAAINEYDLRYGRPFTPLVPVLVSSMLPQGIAMYAGLTGLLRFLSGVLVYGIVRASLPRAHALALAAGILFVVNPAEQTRFAAVYMQGYAAVVCLSLLSMYLFVRSCQNGDWRMLLAGCVALAAAAFVVELALLTAVLTPLILIFRFHKRPWIASWLFAWGAAWGVAGLRLFLFLVVTPQSYQAGLDTSAELHTRFYNLLSQFLPIANYFEPHAAPFSIWMVSLSLGVVSAAVFGWLLSRETAALRTRRYWLMGSFALFSVVVAIILFNGTARDSLLGSLRTQFMAAPGQALFWTAIIGYAAARLPQRWRTLLPACVLGVAITLSCVDGWTAQSRRFANPETRYAHIVNLVQSVAAVAPRFAPEARLGFVLPDTPNSPVGWSYGITELSQYVFGVPGYLVGHVDQFGVLVMLGEAQPDNVHFVYGFPAEEMILFSVDSEGRAALLTTVPEGVAVDATAASRYDSMRLLDADAPPLPGMRFFSASGGR